MRYEAEDEYDHLGLTLPILLVALLGTLAQIALTVLALAAGTMLVLGLAVAAVVWLSGSRPTRQPRRS